MNAATKRVIFAAATLAAGFSAQRICRSHLGPPDGTGAPSARPEVAGKPQGRSPAAGPRQSPSAIFPGGTSLSGIARFLAEFPAPLDPAQFASYFRDYIEPQPAETRGLLVKYIFAGFGADHLDSGIALTGEIPDSGLKLQALKALAENCRPAPDTANRLLGGCASFDQRREVWVALVGAIPCRDPKEHFEAASELSAAIKSLLPEAGSMELLAGGIARHWARKDPMAAWEFGGTGNDLPSILLRKEAFAALSGSRPELALGLVRNTKLSDSNGEKEYYLTQVYSVIFQSDATIRSSDIAIEDLKLPKVAAGIRSAMGKWSSAQIDQFFTRNPDLVGQPLFKEFYLKRALIAGGDQLAKLLEDGGLKDLGKLNLEMLSLSEPPDPRSLAVLLGTSGVSQHFEKGVESIAWRDLAGRDLALAIATVDAMEDKDAAKRALENIIAQVGKEDPAKGVEMINSRSLPPKERDALIGKLVVTWSQRDLGAALAWADTLDPGAGKLAALSSMVGAVPVPPEDLVEAFGKALNTPGSLADTKDFPIGQVRLASSAKAAMDPLGALAWADSLQNEEGAKAARGEAYATWAATDTLAFSDWLARTESPKDYEIAVNALVKNIPDNLSMALTWTATIPDEAVRKESLLKLFKQGEKLSGRNVWDEVPAELKGDLEALVGSP
jgi:hypothetical protein